MGLDEVFSRKEERLYLDEQNNNLLYINRRLENSWNKVALGLYNRLRRYRVHFQDGMMYEFIPDTNLFRNKQRNIIPLTDRKDEQVREIITKVKDDYKVGFFTELFEEPDERFRELWE